MADDLKGKSAEMPIVVFAHIPLWTVYEKWGWGTDDGARAIELMKRFGSVTVLNGHIHQVMQKVEGNVMFHTAMATAFPQPAPGTAPSPGPMKVADDKLRSLLGVTDVNFVQGQPAARDHRQAVARLRCLGRTRFMQLSSLGRFSPSVGVGGAFRSPAYALLPLRDLSAPCLRA
jgi:hypothetical protein